MTKGTAAHERAEVVAFLRDIAEERALVGDDDAAFWLNECADTIENGHHITTPKD